MIYDDYLPLGPLRHLKLRRNRILEIHFHQECKDSIQKKTISMNEAQHRTKMKTKNAKEVISIKDQIVQFLQKKDVDVTAREVESTDVAILSTVLADTDGVSNKGEEFRTDAVVVRKHRRRKQVDEVVTSLNIKESLLIVQSDLVVAATTASKERKKKEKKACTMSVDGQDYCSPELCKKKRKIRKKIELNHGLLMVNNEKKDVIYWDRSYKGDSMPKKS